MSIRADQRQPNTDVDPSIDFGYRTTAFQLPGFSWRASWRLIMISALLFAVASCIAVVGLTIGDYPLSISEAVNTLVGGGSKFQQMIVLEWRAPILLGALVFGGLLGIGGAIFQSLSRNPLGSPDIIGFDAGSYTAVIVMILIIGNRSYWPIAGAAIVGGLLTAFVVYVLAYRQGIQGFRLIIVGIGVTAILGSINSYLITRAAIEDAMAVGFWSAGSLARISWTSLLPSMMIATVVIIAAAALEPGLRRLELGDDAAVTLGTRVGAVRLGLIVVGVATTALVTAAAGPIGFIALVAPQIARRLTHTPGTSLLAAAAMGSLLLVGAQVLSLVLGILYRPVPAGLITVCVGGLYLIWLLVRETRRQYGVMS